MASNSVALKPDNSQLNGQYSTFYVDDLFFGVDVLDVQEVLRFQQMTPVPQAPEVIEGLINLRGQIVTAIDLRRQLQLPRREGDKTPMNIVVRTSDGAVSLLVDEIGDVLDVDAATYERPPENLNSAARELIRGVYKLKDQLLLVLDTEKASDVCSAQPSHSENTAGVPWNAVAETADPIASPRATSRKTAKKPAANSANVN